MALDNVGCDLFKLVRPPFRIAILVDYRGPNTLDEIVPGDCGKRDAKVLPKAFLQPLE
jgi:hypothetical protein